MQQIVPIESQTIERPHWGAGFGLRAAAQIIDLVIHNVTAYIGGIFGGVIIAIYALATRQSPSFLTSKLQTTSLIWYIFPLLGYVIYHTVCESVYGATLGKLIMKTQVVDENGSRCSFHAAFFRSLAFFVDALFFGLVAALSMNRSELKQRYGDKWAHTVVVERLQLSESQKASGWRFFIAFLIAIVADGCIMMLFIVLKAII